MKAVLNVEGSNAGAKFLEEFNGKTIEINSLFKDLEVNSPPLANLIIEGNVFSFQLIDVRFIDDYIFICGFVMDEKTKNGGKTLIRLKPIATLI